CASSRGGQDTEVFFG
nr:TcR V13J1.1 beta chain {complementarity determining region 3} [mice, CBA/J, induced autoimmune thyroiditic, spleen, Peptide Partial, 15 aa] [Mus sp.]